MGLITYKCPNCGGDLRFDADSQKYRCEYCLSVFEAEAMEQQAVSSDADLYRCPNCGAEIVTDETTAADFCYYCHTPVVLEGKLRGAYRPDCVLPFAIDREKALAIFGQWIKKKKFLPSDFYSKEQIEKLSGVYFPYWLYDCQVDGALSAKGIRRKTEMAGTMCYTRTMEYDVQRNGEMQVEHVTRNALSKANRKLVEGVLPFDMEKLAPFEMGYLSGFLAEKRDMEETVFQNEVQQEVRQYAADSLRSAAGAGGGYDEVQVREIKTDLSGEHWAYALLPVWTLTYKDSKTDKIYYFACNGQTGKVCGELPVDTGKLMKLFAAVFVPVFAVLLAVGYLL